MVLLLAAAAHADCTDDRIEEVVGGSATTSAFHVRNINEFEEFWIFEGTHLNSDVAFDEGFEPIPSTTSHSDMGAWEDWWIRPDVELEVGVEYSLLTPQRRVGKTLVSWGPDENAPTDFSGIVAAESQTGASRWIDVTVDFASDDDAFVYEIELADNSGFNGASTSYFHLEEFKLVWNDRFCPGPNTTAVKGAKDKYIRARAVDMSGNATEWSDVWQPDTLCACSASGRLTAGWLLIAAATWTGSRRRRPSRPRRATASESRRTDRREDSSRSR